MRQNTRSLRSPGVAMALALVLALAGASVVQAQPDLVISSMTVQGTPKKGACNTVAMTVRNNGDQFTNTASIGIALITHTQGNAFQNRVVKNEIISPLQAGGQSSFNLSNVEFAAEGAMTVQALVDSGQVVAETNENNNTATTNVTVSGECYVAPRKPLTTQRGGCDLELKFVAPTGSTVPSNSATTFTLQAKNVGSAACDSTKLRLYTYSGSSASVYGRAVGGTRNIWTIPALAPGQDATNSWSDSVKKGTHTYAPKFLGAWNDQNNNNHRPTKTVKAQ